MHKGMPFLPGRHAVPPNQAKKPGFLKECAKEMIKSTGHEEITLSSLSSSDYKELPELVYWLIDEFKEEGINISLPSLRIDTFALDVMSKVQDIRKSSLTFAPEAGTQRLRDVINKGLSEEDILMVLWKHSGEAGTGSSFTLCLAFQAKPITHRRYCYTFR